MLKITAILLLGAALAIAAPEDETRAQDAPSLKLEQLPADAKELADQAKAAFTKGDYEEAEKLYTKAVEIAPNNLYVVSNLGVTQYRNLKYAAAAKSFRKAIAISPGDDFSWCTLGIVQYTQNLYDEALASLAKSTELNPKNATAHNYLGITAAQKGQVERARKELEKAIELDPKYADAYFNLAVTFTLERPPNFKEARKAYKKSLELGAEPDEAMEKTLSDDPAAEEEKPKRTGPV